MGFVVALDGPAGSGKGTVTKKVAEIMNLVNIDTGAMYRCVTLECIYNNILPTEIDKIEKILENIDIKQEKFNKFIYENYSPNKKCERMYLTSENALRIDFIRNKIEEWRNKELINKNYDFIIVTSEIAGFS